MQTCVHTRGLWECLDLSCDYVAFKCLPCPRTSRAAWQFLVFVRLFLPQYRTAPSAFSFTSLSKVQKAVQIFPTQHFFNKKILLHQEEYAYSGTWCLFQCIYCWQAHSCFLLFSFIVKSCASADSGISGGCCSLEFCITGYPQFHYLHRLFH